MKLIKLVTALMVLISSTSAFADPTNGGHDGGGANLWTSSAPEVNAAIQWALSEVKKGGTNWLFMAQIYGPKMIREGDRAEVNVIHCLSQPIVCENPEAIDNEIRGGRKLFRNAWDYLKLSPIELKTDGPCPAKDKAHAAGSVSAFEVGAKLCLSVPELSRTVPSGLKAQVASVLAHEMAHLLGYNEEVAFGVQKGVVENFPVIMRTDGGFLAYRLVYSMMNADSALANAASFSKDGAMSIGFFLLGQVMGTLQTVVATLPDGVNDNTIPVAKPELFETVKSRFSDLESELTTLGWKSQISDVEFDAEVARLRKQTAEASRLLEEFLGQHVVRN